MPGKEAASSPDALYQRIHAAYASLPAGERRVADLLLEAPGDLAVWTASELARRAGVSNATVTRAFRRIGYRSYDEARRTARQARGNGSPLSSWADGAGAAAVDALSLLVADEMRVVELTLSRLDPRQLAAAAEALARARQVRLLGFRNSRFLADYVTAALSQMRPGVAPMLLAGQTRAEGVAALGPGDVALVVGLRRRPAGFAELVKAVAARGAQILLIADASIREVPADADWTFECVVETSQFADSYAGAVAMLRLLVLEVARRLGPEGRAHLEQVEALRARLGELE